MMGRKPAQEITGLIIKHSSHFDPLPGEPCD